LTPWLRKTGNCLAIYEADYTATDPIIQQKELHLYGSDRIGIRKKLGNTDSMDPGQEDRTRGKTLYQLSNHLGNVLTTITDQKLGILNGNDFNHYQASTVSATDYYPFGFEMNDRTFSSDEYRFGFNDERTISDGGGMNVPEDIQVSEPRQREGLPKR
jgi:hypothetical protein